MEEEFQKTYLPKESSQSYYVSKEEIKNLEVFIPPYITKRKTKEICHRKRNRKENEKVINVKKKKKKKNTYKKKKT